MKQELALVALVVRDYNEAIAFYTNVLKFVLVEDTYMSESKRWVVVAPPGSSGCKFLIAKAATPEQMQSVGNQTGGRVFLFLHTDNFERDYQNLLDNNVKIVRGPNIETYGRVVVFADLYGNLWDLIEPA